MKKLLIFILILASANSFGDLYDKDYLSNLTKTQAEDEFKPFAKMITQTLNGGLGDVMNVGLVKIGAEMVIVPFDKTGFLASAPVSFLPMPYAYGGVSLFGLILFGRAMMLPVQSGGKNPILWGGGISHEMDFTPLITIEPAATYHNIANLDAMDIQSFGFQLQGRLNLMILTPYANLGLSYTKFDTDITVLGGQKFSYSTTLFQTSVGLKVFFLFFEIGFTPATSYSFGASIGF